MARSINIAAQKMATSTLWAITVASLLLVASVTGKKRSHFVRSFCAHLRFPCDVHQGRIVYIFAFYACCVNALGCCACGGGSGIVHVHTSCALCCYFY